MKDMVALIVKSRAATLALLALLIMGGAGCSDDGGDDDRADTSAHPPEFNIKVQTVDAEGNPLETEYFRWAYIDSDGNTPNVFEVACADGAEKCSEREIGFEAVGAISLFSSTGTHADPDDPDCHNGLEGDASMDADPTLEQTVQVVLDHEWRVCQ